MRIVVILFLVLNLLISPLNANEEEYEQKLLERRRMTEEEEVSRGGYRSLSMEISAYSEHFESCGKHPWEEGYGFTASGEYVQRGIVAADMKVLPMNSLIFIEGLGKFEVKDTGGAIRGSRLDLYVPSHEEALQWGRQTRKVYILRLGER